METSTAQAPSPQVTNQEKERALTNAESKARHSQVDITHMKSKFLSKDQLALLDEASEKLGTFAQSVRASTKGEK